MRKYNYRKGLSTNKPNNEISGNMVAAECCRKKLYLVKEQKKSIKVQVKRAEWPEAERFWSTKRNEELCGETSNKFKISFLESIKRWFGLTAGFDEESTTKTSCAKKNRMQKNDVATKEECFSSKGTSETSLEIQMMMKMSQSPYLKQAPSPVNYVLRSPNCSLERLLELPDVLTELKVNKRLQQFICGERVLDKLFDYICGTGDEKFQSPATQIVCCEIMTISENIFYFPHLITSLFAEIAQSNDEMTISCIARVLTVLLNLPTSNVFDIMAQTKNVINYLMNKITNYEVAQFLIGVMRYSHDDESCKATGAHWLCENGFVSELLKIFIQSNEQMDDCKIESVSKVVEEIALLKEASLVFCDFLNTNENLEQFYSAVFTSQSPLLLEKGLVIIQNILACCASSGDLCVIPYDGLPKVYREICKYTQIIENKLKYESGPITPIRIQLVYLILSMTISNYSYVYNKIIEHKLLELLMDVFFNYNHNCTIFRQVAFDILSYIINQSIELLKSSLLGNSLLKRLVEEDKKSVEFHSQFKYYPDHHSLNVLLMNNIHLVADEDSSDDAHGDGFMNSFEEYFDDVVLPREPVLSNHYLCEVLPRERKEQDEGIFDFFDDEM